MTVSMIFSDERGMIIRLPRRRRYGSYLNRGVYHLERWTCVGIIGGLGGCKSWRCSLTIGRSGFFLQRDVLLRNIKRSSCL